MKRNHLFTGIATMILMVGGFAFAKSTHATHTMSQVQLETLETLAHDEFSGVVSCSYCKGSNCFVYSKGELVATYHDSKVD